MKLYFSPLACSLATRIAFYEAGVSADYVEVDPKTKRTLAGADFLETNPLGLVPVLETDDGDLLTENAAILQHVAAAFPDARLAPSDARGRTRLHQWLGFIGTELHKAVFVPLLDKRAPAVVKEYALERAPKRLAWVESHLVSRQFVFDTFSIADAYLFTVLNWSLAATQVRLGEYPAISAYMARMRERPSIAKAFAEELTLYRAEQARHAA